MRKRISLLIIGFVLFLGAFLIYQYATNASFLGPKTAPPPKVAVIDPNQPLSIEERLPNGDLLYVLYAQKATPMIDPNTGKEIRDQYKLDEPSATYYTPDGRVIYIRADSGTIAVDQSKGSKGKATAFGGKLSGHVRLVWSPREVPIDITAGPKPGQLEVTLDKDVEMSMTDCMLTSPGGVHVRSEEFGNFDGEDLTVAFKKIKKSLSLEYLRVDPSTGQDNDVIIHNVGQGESLLGDTTGGKEGAGNSGPQNPEAMAAVAGGAPAATAPATPSATLPGLAAPDKAEAYKLCFSENVRATLGASQLTSSQLFVLFSMPARGKGKPLLPPAQTEAADKKAKGNDLRVTWKGPLEIRSLGPDDMALTDEKDRALEAVGTAANPVTVTTTDVKGGISSVKAGRLWYHLAEKRVELEPDSFGYVEVIDPSMGAVACHGVTYLMAGDKLKLVGPGTLEIPRKSAKPMMISWSKTIDATLASAGDPTNLRKKAIRHALLSGDVSIKDAGLDMTCETLDLLLANNPEKNKNAPVPEHLLADGKVRIKSARSEHGIALSLDNKPQGLNADRLEVLTEPTPGTNMPALSRLLATGDVEAWTYSNLSDTMETSKTGNQEKRLVRQTIYTPTLDVGLEPREKAAGGAVTADLAFGSGTEIKSLVAGDGVKIEIEGSDESQTKVATAKTLVTDPRTGKAVLKGDSGLGQPNGIPKLASVSMGGNKIEGAEIFLDQKAHLDPKGLAHSIEIPGKGTFTFVEPSKTAGEKDTTVQITWTQKMTYDERTRLARFLGHIDTQTLEQPEPHSKMTCEEFLEVQLAESGTLAATEGAAKGGGEGGKGKKPQIVHMTAKGDVCAYGMRYDPIDKEKLLARMFIRTPEINYTEATKLLEIPHAGGIWIEDYREPKGDKDTRGNTEFHWGGNTTFAGDTGLITMNDNVHVEYDPVKPLKMAAGDSGKAKPIRKVTIDGDKLTAKLVQNPATGAVGNSSNPMGLGTGDELKLAGAKAQGNARLQFGEDEASADTLDFDAVKNIATITGKGREKAHLVRPGKDLLDAHELIWNLTTGEVRETGMGGIIDTN